MQKINMTAPHLRREVNYADGRAFRINRAARVIKEHNMYRRATRALFDTLTQAPLTSRVFAAAVQAEV